ncbi:NAD-dependent epimerase/dehydratase family protein [Actinocorallia sp. A-T 12471]|uniref:NAD-dependent epimerase/dehydratase family protein n=1 Tax=Actinocorallia sp. A-T 12471 TaxID=3089813 RepID=UPI0029D049C1|nr:NAD-dependent epimerase/dehydratase family protein [Actinocorallia sp. A-T 12471]MDX6740412.1 NAD-dependent epimerase/dehydratase family protein [Actinocorallia sp. A-T 12471]
MGETVLVTGGSGFVGSHLLAALLARGYRVRATVRDLADMRKTGPLRGLPGAERLDLYAADLLRPGSFAEAMDGCRTVFHVASPFRMPEKIRDGRAEMLQPALEGTRNVLGTVDATPSVERVVLTSTVGAIFGDYIDVHAMRDRTLTEEYWNTTSTIDTNPYHHAKTMAEREAWQIADAQDRWSLVVLNPGLVLGPSFTPSSESGSLFLMDELMRGLFFYGAPDFSFTVVDVRDVAEAHIRAAETPSAKGRYILAHPDMYSFAQIAKIIRSHYPRKFLIPRHTVPNAAVRVLGPRFGLTQDYIRNHLGIRFTVDNTRSTRDFALTYRRIDQTILDHYEAWRS